MDNNLPENINKPEMPAVEIPTPEQLTSPRIETESSPEQEPVLKPEAELGEAPSLYQSQNIQTAEETEIQEQASYIAPLPEEEKLAHLKLLARDKSVEKAIAVVKKMDDPWLEDKFHDDLMDDAELRAQLESLGKIEKL